MFTDKIEEIVAALKRILSIYNVYGNTLNNKISDDDIVLHILAIGCKYAYDMKAEKHSLNYYLGGSSNVDDSERMMHQRTMKYVQNHGKIIDRFFKRQGFYTPKRGHKSFENMNDKLQGYEINEFQFWELCNIHDMKLVKAITNKQIGKGNFTTKQLQAISDEYNAEMDKFKNDWEDIKEHRIFDFLAMFTLEWKYSFEFCTQIANKMVEKNIKYIPNLPNRIHLFNAPQQVIGNFFSPYRFPIIENRMINIRDKFIDNIVICDDKEFNIVEEQYREVLNIVGMIWSLPDIREIFLNQTNERDWISVFEEYDIFQFYNQHKEWNKKNTRYLKDIYNHISFDYKNHENRS